MKEKEIYVCVIIYEWMKKVWKSLKLKNYAHEAWQRNGQVTKLVCIKLGVQKKFCAVKKRENIVRHCASQMSIGRAKDNGMSVLVKPKFHGEGGKW